MKEIKPKKRHNLKGELINIGGNIGYAIRPSERRKGYATIQLQLLLEKAKELGLEKVLVTCRDNNVGSRTTSTFLFITFSSIGFVDVSRTDIKSSFCNFSLYSDLLSSRILLSPILAA